MGFKQFQQVIYFLIFGWAGVCVSNAQPAGTALREMLANPTSRVALQRVGRALLTASDGVSPVIAEAFGEGSTSYGAMASLRRWLAPASHLRSVGLSGERAGQMVLQLFEDALAGRESFHAVNIVPSARAVTLTADMRGALVEIGDRLAPTVRQVERSRVRVEEIRRAAGLAQLDPATLPLLDRDFSRLLVELRTVDAMAAAMSRLQLEFVARAASRFTEGGGSLLGGGRMFARAGANTGELGAAARAVRVAQLERDLGIPGIGTLGETIPQVQARLREMEPWTRSVSRGLRSMIEADAASARALLEAHPELATRAVGERRMKTWLESRPAVAALLRALSPTTLESLHEPGSPEVNLLRLLGDRQFARVFNFGSRHYGVMLYFQSHSADLGNSIVRRFSPTLEVALARRPELARSTMDELLAGGIVQTAAQSLQYADVEGSVSRLLHPDESIDRGRVGQAMDQWFTEERWRQVIRSLCIIEFVNGTIVFAMVPKLNTTVAQSEIPQLLNHSPQTFRNMVTSRFTSFLTVGAISGFAGTILSNAWEGQLQQSLSREGAFTYTIETAKTASYLAISSLLRYAGREIILNRIGARRVHGGRENFLDAYPNMFSMADGGLRLFNNSLGSGMWVMAWSPTWELIENRLRTGLTTRGVLNQPIGPSGEFGELPQR